MTKKVGTLAIVFSLAVGCSSGNGNSNGDLGGGDLGGGDLSGSSDMASLSLSQLSLVAGLPGGPGNIDAAGTAARFGGAFKVASDGAGNLYVSDTGAGVSPAIRKIVVATGAVTTLVAKESYSDLVADGAGNLYHLYNDLGSSTSAVRKLAIANGTVTTIAGGARGSADGTGAAAKFDTPGGLAWDGADTLYVADSNNQTIRKVSISTGIVTTLAGTSGIKGSKDGTGTAASFNNPRGVAVDGAGKVYVADYGNHTIRQINAASGVVTTLAGQAGMPGYQDGTGPMAGFSNPEGVTWDGTANLYVNTAFAIRKIVAATGVVTTFAGKSDVQDFVDATGTAARFSQVDGTAWDGAGNLYVADNYAVRKVVVATAAVTTFAGMNQNVGRADGTGMAARFPLISLYGHMAADGAGNLYVTQLSGIRQISVATGAVTTLSAQLNAARSVTWDGNGNLYTADYTTIAQIAMATGKVTRIAGANNQIGSMDGTGATASFSNALAVTWDGAGNLYVADTGNHTIRQVQAATGVVTTFAGTAGMAGQTDGVGPAARFNFPLDVVSDHNGSLYVADGNNYTIRRIMTSTGAVSTITTATDPKFMPISLTLDGAGNLYVAGSDARGPWGIVRKIVLATGAVSTAVGTVGQMGVVTGALPGSISSSRGLGWVPGQGLAISDFYENVILLAR